MYLLFDIGGTNLRVAFSKGDSIDNLKIIPTPEGFDEGIRAIKQIADEISRGEKFQAVAGGIAGPLNREKSMLLKSPHISGWIEKPLKSRLEEVFQATTLLENDAILCGLGEAGHGAGIGKNIVVYLTVGTGLGGARIVNQKPDTNAFGFEPGHQIIVIDGKLCNCGKKGHLEAYVGGSYLEKEYGKTAESITDQKIWDDVAKYLSIGLNNTIVHWSPDIVVLGGSMMQSISLDKVKSYVRDNLTIFPEAPEIITAKLGHEAGLYGALKLLQI